MGTPGPVCIGASLARGLRRRRRELRLEESGGQGGTSREQRADLLFRGPALKRHSDVPGVAPSHFRGIHDNGLLAVALIEREPQRLADVKRRPADDPAP